MLGLTSQIFRMPRSASFLVTILVYEFAIEAISEFNRHGTAHVHVFYTERYIVIDSL